MHGQQNVKRNYGICLQLVHLFQVSLSCLISTQYQLSFIWIALGYVDYVFHACWQENSMLLKRQLNELHDYITNIINPIT